MKNIRGLFSRHLYLKSNSMASVDLGQQHIAPLLAKFGEKHPEVSAKLHLSDGVVNLLEEWKKVLI